MRSPGWKHDPETRARIAEAQRAHWRDPAYREKVREKIKARWADPEFRARRLPPTESTQRPTRAQRRQARLAQAEDQFRRWVSQARLPAGPNGKTWRPRGHEPWTPVEDRYLLDHGETTVREIARVLGRTMRAVSNRRSELARNGPPRGAVRLGLSR